MPTCAAPELTSNQIIAETIREQLGGRRFALMTGATCFLAIKDGLSFRLPARFATSGINYVAITLNGKDLYDLEFLKIGPRPSLATLIKNAEAREKVTTLVTYHDVFNSDLQRIFSKGTGLDTHL